MKNAIGSPILRSSWRAPVVLAVVFGSGCAFAVGDAARPVSSDAPPHLLFRISDFSPDARSVQLVPQELDRAATFSEALDTRLSIGGMASFTSGNRGYGPDRLALVIVAENESVKPLLSDFRQLLLDIDGQQFRTHPMPDPRLYALESTGIANTETVIVPIDRRLLSLMVRADRVRGRVGHWLAFDLSDDVRKRLGDLLTALPEDFPSGHRRIAASPLHRATF